MKLYLLRSQFLALVNVFKVMLCGLKQLFYTRPHSSVHPHASEPTSLGTTCSSGQLTNHTHSCIKDTALGAVVYSTSCWTHHHVELRALRLKNEPPEPQLNLLITILMIMTSCDIRCVQTIVVGLWPSEEWSHDLWFYWQWNTTTACSQWCFHCVNLIWCDSGCLKKVKKVNINCLIQFKGCVHSVSGSVWLKGWQRASCLCCHEGATIQV